MIADVDMGVGITTIQLMNVTPPQEVEAAYNEVLQAQQEKDKIVNEAKMEYNKKVIPVEGEAQRLIAQAEGYEAQRVKVAEGEAKYFEALYSEYIKAPDVTKKRMYLETISEILPKLEDITIIDENQRNLLPFLPLNSQNGKAQGGK
jgi:membrane protease subunit HflK